MGNNKIFIEYVKDKLIGLRSCYIGVAYGCHLKLSLGEKRFYENNELKGKFHGDWDIVSSQCTWRVRRDKVILCGYGDEIEYSSEKLHLLELGTVKDIKQSEIFDLTIVFDSGIIIDYFMNITYEPQLTINSNENLAYELTEEGFMEIDPKELFQKSSKIDSVLSAYSDECCKRWSNLVSKTSSDNICDNCFYFRSIDGSFYFWKFGLCSNGASKFDGKLVGIQSGCEQFKELKDLIH